MKAMRDKDSRNRTGGVDCLPDPPSGKTLQGLRKSELLSQVPRSSNGEVTMTIEDAREVRTDPVSPAWKGLVLIEQLRCKFTQKLKRTPGAWPQVCQAGLPEPW